MPAAPVDYDPLAPGYHARYAVNPLPGVAAALQRLARPAARALEAGCGTGRWLSELAGATRMFGLDLSRGMLAQARAAAPGTPLTQGTAIRLPFASASFDLIFSVNALHHFPQPEAFVVEARRLLRRAGCLAVVGMDPHAGRDRWFLYDYFPGAREADLERFPACEQVSDWMEAAGLRVDNWNAVEHISAAMRGRAVLEDYFLEKGSTSQLALLSEAAYAAGRRRLEAALDEAERAGRTLSFETNLAMVMVTGRAP